MEAETIEDDDDGDDNDNDNDIKMQYRRDANK
jgi:hypothetical protein